MPIPALSLILPPERAPGSRGDLLAKLAMIDGWGIRGWLQILGLWRLSTAFVAFDPIEGDEDDVACRLILAEHGLGIHAPGSPTAAAVCDWLLRQAWSSLSGDIGFTTYRPTDQIRDSNACYYDGQGHVCLRLRLRLPMLGMCCDAPRLEKFIRRLERFAGSLSKRAKRPALAALVKAVAAQEALRAALPSHGLVAFLGDGSRLARDAEGRAQRSCRPLRTPPALRVRIDLGKLGRFSGLGIRAGITALAGAPYHGKSTLLRAIGDGIWNHRPGDGRELVVSDASALIVQAEEGRSIKRQDLSGFFARLPHADARDFSTGHASGATSMAASVLQGIAAGSRLLLIDEDTAAGNFLAIDAVMRRLLGKSLHGAKTLLEVLPSLAKQGISAVLVAGAHQQSLAVADRVLQLDHFQPRDVTATARRLAKPPVFSAFSPPDRVINDDADCLLGPRHFLAVDARDVERPVVADQRLDLRRSGWAMDEALARGACCAAAWCCRLAHNRRMPLSELGETYRRFIAERGARGLDPFDADFIVAPPWQLAITTLERLVRPRLESARNR